MWSASPQAKDSSKHSEASVATNSPQASVLRLIQFSPAKSMCLICRACWVTQRLKTHLIWRALTSLTEWLVLFSYLMILAEKSSIKHKAARTHSWPKERSLVVLINEDSPNNWIKLVRINSQANLNVAYLTKWSWRKSPSQLSGLETVQKWQPQEQLSKKHSISWNCQWIQLTWTLSKTMTTTCQ